MGLLADFEENLALMLEDANCSPVQAITLTDPAGVTYPPLTGKADDIAQMIDPETGEAVSGRKASIALRLSSIYDAGANIPMGVHDETQKPWLVTFQNVNGFTATFRVKQSNPDRNAGIITLLLGFWASAEF